MKIVVCIKQVPAKDAPLAITDASWIRETDIGFEMNEPDSYALEEALRLKDRTVFLDFQTDPTENVFPMVQAGKGITEMLLGSEDL